jgi:hypothetical protein
MFAAVDESILRVCTPTLHRDSPPSSAFQQRTHKDEKGSVRDLPRRRLLFLQLVHMTWLYAVPLRGPRLPVCGRALQMEGVSLRPGGAGSLRPGGGGLLTSFASGSRPKPSVGAKEKGYDEVIKYDRDYLMAFKEVCATRSLLALVRFWCLVLSPDRLVCVLQRCTDVPAELEASGSDVLLGGENEFPVPEERCVAAPVRFGLCLVCGV